ncbi:MAG: hypothetical protein ABJA94_11595 [Rhodoglobus sp.]
MILETERLTLRPWQAVDVDFANFASQAICERIGLVRQGLSSKYYNEECELFVGTP